MSYELEELAAQLRTEVRELPFEEPVPQSIADRAEELAEAVLDYFREKAWAETMAELNQRRVS